jgi:pantoate--beta-alanine ligase
MKVVRSAGELRTALDPQRAQRRSIGFVATLGALHQGHMSHVRSARASCDVVAVSIFVNPLQFGPNEDYDAYPRDERRDLSLLDGAGTDVVFIPSVGEMYAAGASTTVTVGPLANAFEGADRPGHFDGVCTVVAKLFNLVHPDQAFFGQKDAQQVAAIKKMVSDLDFPVAIVVGPTIREPDGLAMSSRNAYLTAEDRVKANALYRALRQGRSRLLSTGNVTDAEKEMVAELQDAGVEVHYAVACDPDTFARARRDGPVLLAVAATVGRARLIDNLLLSAEELRQALPEMEA